MNDCWKSVILIAAVEVVIAISVLWKKPSDQPRANLFKAALSAAALVCAVVALFLLRTQVSNLVVFSIAMLSFFLGLALFKKSEVAMAATFLSGGVIAFTLEPFIALMTVNGSPI